MSRDPILAELFEVQRPRLRAIAYRMLGSIDESEDAVQETWIRLSSTDSGAIENLGGWLTTVVGRICLNVLRSRRRHGEEPLAFHVPDPLVSQNDEIDPEHQSVLTDSVGLALLVVLETLSPAERVAFVLYDMFSVSYDEIATMLNRSPMGVRQLASRARRRVRQDAPPPDVGIQKQRQVVDAFFAAARDGDFEALIRILDPNVLVRGDGGTVRPEVTGIVRGAEAVAAQALTYSRLSPFVRPILVNGVAGVVVAPQGRPFSVMAFTVRGGRIVAIEALSDPIRLGRLDLGL